MLDPPVFRPFGSKLAVQGRYNQNLFLRVLSGPLQGIAVRPLPCNYYVIFHGGNTGSNPVGDAKPYQQLEGTVKVFRRHKKGTAEPLDLFVLPFHNRFPKVCRFFRRHKKAQTLTSQLQAPLPGRGSNKSLHSALCVFVP